MKIEPYVLAKRGYRIYYGSTHWVKRYVVTREEKSLWYEIYDSQLRKHFYVPMHKMRLVPDEELTPLSPEVPNEAKTIVVDLASQLVSAFEGEKLVMSQRCSSGAEGTETPSGEFLTYHKGPSVHMTNQGEEDIPDLLERGAHAGACTATYSLLRLSGTVESVFVDRLAEAFPERIAKITNRLREVKGGTLTEGRFFKRQEGQGPY